jgi:hypothetical protein
MKNYGKAMYLGSHNGKQYSNTLHLIYSCMMLSLAHLHIALFAAGENLHLDKTISA